MINSSCRLTTAPTFLTSIRPFITSHHRWNHDMTTGTWPDYWLCQHVLFFVCTLFVVHCCSARQFLLLEVLVSVYWAHTEGTVGLHQSSWVSTRPRRPYQRDRPAGWHMVLCLHAAWLSFYLRYYSSVIPSVEELLNFTDTVLHWSCWYSCFCPELSNSFRNSSRQRC